MYRHFHCQLITIRKFWGKLNQPGSVHDIQQGLGFRSQTEVETGTSFLTIKVLNGNQPLQRQDKRICLFHITNILFYFNT